jgi:phage protein D
MIPKPDFYVPAFEVQLRGRPLAKDVVRDIIQVSYRDNIQDVDSFEITINNWDAGKHTFKYIDQDLFDPGKELELMMGYVGEPLRSMIKGQITSLRPSFPSGGQPTLAISGLNVIHKFRSEQKTRSYTNLTDSQIAKQMESKDQLGVKINVNDEAAAKEPRYGYVLQDNQYDIVFLMERARRVGYDLYVKENGQSELFFEPSNNVKDIAYKLSFAKYRLGTGDAANKLFPLIDFKPELSTAQQVSEVTVKGWNPKTKKPISQTANRKELKTKSVGGNVQKIEESFSERKEIITDRPVSTDAEAKKLALASLDMIAKQMVKGNGSTIGLPDLRAGSRVEMDGMGERFSGTYFVTATTHSIGDGGYTTNFECRREGNLKGLQ